MHVYLPIAELSVHILWLLTLGGMAGLLAGLFGIGGGFLMTPLLIFTGVSPAVAVASSANQIIASSFSGFLAHWKRNNVDFKMGTLLLIGGLIGSTAGVQLFGWLQKLGHIDLFISVTYVLFLMSIGGLMARESWGSILKKKEQKTNSKPKHPAWIKTWPMQMDFHKSDLRITALLPIGVGVMSGLLVSLMGIGGGFIMIPAMIYILAMPTSVVIGTSLFQIIFVTAHVTFMHAVSTHTVDIILAILLLIGSVIGAQVGTRVGGKLSPIYLRGILAAIVLAVALRLAYGLFITPDELFTLVVHN